MIGERAIRRARQETSGVRLQDTPIIRITKQYNISNLETRKLT